MDAEISYVAGVLLVLLCFPLFAISHARAMDRFNRDYVARQRAAFVEDVQHIVAMTE